MLQSFTIAVTFMVAVRVTEWVMLELILNHGEWISIVVS